MKYLTIILLCALPGAALAAGQYSADYYFHNEDARVALEMHCYPGSDNSVAAVDCRNAWQAGQRIVKSIVPAPSRTTDSGNEGWAEAAQGYAHAAGQPLYPNAPEEQQTNPAYWRIRGQANARDYVTSLACPASSADVLGTAICKAAHEALAASWQPATGGH